MATQQQDGSRAVSGLADDYGFWSSKVVDCRLYRKFDSTSGYRGYPSFPAADTTHPRLISTDR
ncbi:hypothetical protein N7494_001734 [Penicillium frequentans]|uniref:Uncharacterized protein n=1 Tax=Penicillium frequentans TaxID=3151616 RepID=A0AAD6GJI8_9EURO|nr:hypothetical protein N7494_001734 [Penicillium glabrum]